MPLTWRFQSWEAVANHSIKVLQWITQLGQEEAHMTLLTILQWAAAIGTILTGLFALLRPLAVQGFTGLRAEGGRGVTEIRAVLGGLFIALGFAPLVLNEPAAFEMLGLAYIGVAAVRAVSMVVDRSVERSNIISLVVEIVFGVILVL
jgi:hypothetical protein